MSNYAIMGYSGVEDDLRAIFGVSEDELSNSVIHSRIALPAAEAEVQERLGSFTVDNTEKAKTAILYIAAANCCNAVRANLLRQEDDNRTSAQRFKNANDFSEVALRNRADEIIQRITSSAGDTVSLFTRVSPATDAITGN